MTSMAKSKNRCADCTSTAANRNPTYRSLSRDEEHELAGLIANGDRDARNRLVQANLPLVIKIANDFRGRGMDLNDLIGEGNLGLIRAAEEFDPSFGTRFGTYAAYWIKEKIRHALINTTYTIRLPSHMVALLTKWRRVERALARERGTAPAFEEIASVLALSETQKLLVSKARHALRFRRDSNDALDTARCAPGESSCQGQTCDATLEADDERSMLSLRMQRLKTRDCTILKLRYGLQGEEPLTLKEIGRRLGVTCECVRKIEIRALRQLRDDQSGRAIDSKAGRRLAGKQPGRLPFPSSRQLGA
jgi:RNA polymerase primary sigma factor